MGEYADLFIDGTLDEVTGELIDGTSPGHPRRVGSHKPERVTCPVCGKLCGGVQGLTAHIGAKHEGHVTRIPADGSD